MSNWSRPGIGGIPTCCRKWPRARPTALPARSSRTTSVRRPPQASPISVRMIERRRAPRCAYRYLRSANPMQTGVRHVEREFSRIGDHDPAIDPVTGHRRFDMTGPMDLPAPQWLLFRSRGSGICVAAKFLLSGQSRTYRRLAAGGRLLPVTNGRKRGGLLSWLIERLNASGYQ